MRKLIHDRLKSYGARSIMSMIAASIDNFIADEKISSETFVAIYGLTKLSFSIRTILAKRGIKVAAYVTHDEKEAIETNRYIKTFASRYLNTSSGVIPIMTVSQWRESKGDKAILLAVKKGDVSRSFLIKDGLCEGKDFFSVYDGVNKEFERQIADMRQVPIDEVKAREKAILKYVDEFCLNHDLRYWICGGTLLGAVRHKGFIPWDDDIDIFLPWSDYLRFRQIFLSDGQYVLTTRDDKKPWKHLEFFDKIIDTDTLLLEDLDTYQKISGIWIDVFPLCGLPADEKNRRVLFSEFREIEKEMWESFYTSDGDFDRFGEYYKKQYELMSRFDFDKSDYVGVPGTAYGEKDHTSRHVYDDTLRMKFEDIDVNAPVGYDEYLTNLYGDYMKLPEEDKRVSNHTIEVYL